MKDKSPITAATLQPEEETNVQLLLKNKPDRHLTKEAVGRVTLTINQENRR